VIIAEELALTFFPDGDVLGKEINLFEANPMKSQYPDFTDLDVNLTVTGVFKPFSKTIFHEPDIIIISSGLPKWGEFDLCSIIKSNINTSHIPIILITSDDDK
jgi:CheY-like chemotaxis protein